MRPSPDSIAHLLDPAVEPSNASGQPSSKAEFKGKVHLLSTDSVAKVRPEPNPEYKPDAPNTEAIAKTHGVTVATGSQTHPAKAQNYNYGDFLLVIAMVLLIYLFLRSLRKNRRITPNSNISPRSAAPAKLPVAPQYGYSRPYFRYGIDQLEALMFNRPDLDTLNKLSHELSFRRRPRAVALAKKVRVTLGY